MKYHLERKNRATGKVWIASCEEECGKYIVKKGSIISDIELSRCPKKIMKMRNDAKIDGNRILQEDVAFDSLDDAAAFVLATNAIGKREWK